MEGNKNVYDERNIKHLDTIDAIRLRPAMYIDGIGELGLYKIDSEVVQNCFDEYLIGEATFCKIDYDSNTNMMRIEDDGRGIPVGKLEEILTKAHTGGKFDRNSYEISGGQNGVGSKCANALSTYCKVEVWRAGYIDGSGQVVLPKHGWIEFNCGRKVNEFVEDLPETSTKHGTVFIYSTDDTILKTHHRNWDKFIDYLNTISYIDTGILIELNLDGKKYKFQHLGGMDEFFRDFVKNKGLRPMIEPITITGSTNDFSYDIMFSYGPSNTGDSNIVSFVNGNRTPTHGTHVSSFRSGCALALTQYIQDNDWSGKFPKGIEPSGTLISENIIALVGVRHKDPLFNGQTKEKLTSIDVQEPIKGSARTVFSQWLNSNNSGAKKLVLLALDYAKYEAERRKLKKTLIDSKQTKSIFDSNSIDPSKYHTCRSNNPKEKELFICEGSSAAGTISKGRDSNFQGLYALRGKIFNVAKTGISSHVSKEILDLAQISGLGIPINGKPKYENLAYDKFIILTDADDDGAHIRTLLMTFFWTFYPDLVKEGHVYIANPPLKKISLSNGSHFFLNTESDYDRLMKEFIINSFELYSSKTKKKLSEGLFRIFIDALNGYDVFMDNHAKALVIDPSLLENICINIGIVSQCTDNPNNQYNKEFYKKTGYYIKYFKDTGIITFDKGLYHANIKFDEMFISQHFDPICSRLNEIMIYGVYLKGIRSGHEYHGTLYNLSDIMNGILGKNVIVNRSKGLGESSYEDLAETTLNPMTRILNKVTVEDAIKAQKSIEIFMTDTFIQAKRLFYAGKMDF